VLCAQARQRAASGDLAAAHAAFADAAAAGQRFGDRDLLTLARHGQGRTLVMMNQTDAGLALLDEAMVAVASGEIGPIVSGAVYCSVITACHDIFDVRRAQEWTDALQAWCESQPDLVPFRGYCLIRRSELMQLHGLWDRAIDEARRACARADPSLHPETGAAFYQLGELHRVRGEFTRADEAYRSASQAGRKPQPGLALLRLNQGQLDAAETSIRLALQEARDIHTRVVVLSAAVEILLAQADVAAARTASDELTSVAAALGLPYPNALSASACGAVALAEGEPLRALESLHAACAYWQDLDAPYERAQTRVNVGLAYRQLGDLEGADLELDAAHDAFERLGANPAVARVAALTRPRPASAHTGLTGREVEVLRLVATGMTNHAIAGRLGISERTVDRHVSNIFTKLDLNSRAAATAYAYQHKLL
jgi:DNA-binding NarL/FixJ family response regulator